MLCFYAETEDQITVNLCDVIHIHHIDVPKAMKANPGQRKKKKKTSLNETILLTLNRCEGWKSVAEREKKDAAEKLHF